MTSSSESNDVKAVNGDHSDSKFVTSDKTTAKESTNGKNPPLKRVSFGSSKGSMVETLIYDTSVIEEVEGENEEDGKTYPNTLNRPNTLTQNGISIRQLSPEAGKSASKVRVTFFESEKPLSFSSPDLADELDFMMSSVATPEQVIVQHVQHIHEEKQYVRQQSTDSGIDNPFRPDGELSKEAEVIVKLINSGQPIVGSPSGDFVDSGAEKITTIPNSSPVKELAAKESQKIVKTEAVTVKSGANGSAPNKPTPGTIEVQHGVVTCHSEPSQVERVVLKKKKKNCCVVQ